MKAKRRVGSAGLSGVKLAAKKIAGFKPEGKVKMAVEVKQVKDKRDLRTFICLLPGVVPLPRPVPD